MRYFALLGIQHVVIFVIPTLVFIVLLYCGFARTHIRTRASGERERKVVHVYPDGIEEMDAPFPLILILTIAGFLLWAVFYTLGIGLFEVRI